MRINKKQIEKQSKDEMNSEGYPVTAWCPDGCGLALVCMEENIYYCAGCNKDFKLVEIKKKGDRK